MSTTDALTRIDEGFAPLLEAARRKTPSHAYLLHGPSAAAALHFARFFARALACDAPEAPCETCAACLRALADHAEAIHLVRPSGVDIRIDQIRELIDASRYRSAGGRFKVFVLCPADAMNEQAANAFLKVLEEPTERTVFLLVTARPDALLTTIRSRCIPARLTFPPARRLVEDLLPASHPRRDEAWLALLLSDGGPSIVDWVAALGAGAPETPPPPGEETGSWGLDFLDDEVELGRRLLLCDPLREKADEMLALFARTVELLGELAERPRVEAAFTAGLRVAGAGSARLEEELPKRFKSLRSAWARSEGEGARHPVLGDERDVQATARLWTFTWMDAFLRGLLLALRLGTRLAHGGSDPLLRAVALRHPGLEALARLPLVTIARFRRSIETARRHVYGNVKPLTLILQNLLTSFLQHAGVVPATTSAMPGEPLPRDPDPEETWMEP